MKYLAFLLALSLSGCDAGNHAKTEGVSGSGAIGPSTSANKTNTAVNVRDRDTTTKTPIDQNENQRDIDVTADIRKRVVNSKMSTNAQNVKIITQNGVVTLRGPVQSTDEKRNIEEIARGISGVVRVDSQLEVETNP